MKKNERLDAEAIQFAEEAEKIGLHPCYVGFVRLFNEGRYYEAHDILEHLWLKGAGGDHAYFKGLIQISGGFVHLRLNYLQPNHYKFRHRLRPALRLFELGIGNIRPYGPVYMRLPVEDLCAVCASLIGQIRESEFCGNPWRPETRPRLIWAG